MSKKNLLIILLIILVVILVGIGIFLKNNKQESLGEGESEGVLEKIDVSEEGWTGKLKNALALGESMKCEWEAGEMSSVYYVKGEKSYSETTMDGDVTYLINDGECSYIWKNNETQGSKFCAADLPETKSADEEKDVDTTDFNFSDEQMDYEVNCQKVIINDLIFTPPANIEFTNPLETLNLENLDLEKFGL